MTFVLPPDAKRRPTAEVLTDSVSPNGNRVTTFRILMHRFVLTRCEVAQAPSFRAGLATSPRPQIGSRAIRTSRARTLRHPRVR